MYRNRLGLELAKLQSYQKPSEFLYVSYSNTKTKKPTGIDLVSNDNSVFGKKVGQKHTGIGLLSNSKAASSCTFLQDLSVE